METHTVLLVGAIALKILSNQFADRSKVIDGSFTNVGASLIYCLLNSLSFGCSVVGLLLVAVRLFLP